MENNRVFVTTMSAMCTHLQNLIQDVYTASFPNLKHNILFSLKSSPRLEITTIEVSLMFGDGTVIIPSEKLCP
jgi:hypothetical protein